MSPPSQGHRRRPKTPRPSCRLSGRLSASSKMTALTSPMLRMRLYLSDAQTAHRKRNCTVMETKSQTGRGTLANSIPRPSHTPYRRPNLGQQCLPWYRRVGIRSPTVSLTLCGQINSALGWAIIVQWGQLRKTRTAFYCVTHPLFKYELTLLLEVPRDRLLNERIFLATMALFTVRLLHELAQMHKRALLTWTSCMSSQKSETLQPTVRLISIGWS